MIAHLARFQALSLRRRPLTRPERTGETTSEITSLELELSESVARTDRSCDGPHPSLLIIPVVPSRERSMARSRRSPASPCSSNCILAESERDLTRVADSDQHRLRSSQERHTLDAANRLWISSPKSR